MVYQRCPTDRPGLQQSCHTYAYRDRRPNFSRSLR
jgi:hypothetical protein